MTSENEFASVDVIQNTEKIRDVIKKCIGICKAACDAENATVPASSLEVEHQDEKTEKTEEIDDDEEEAFEERCLEFEAYLEKEFLSLAAIKKLKNFWNTHSKEDKKLYIHELLVGNELKLDKYQPPKRDPELEARIQTIKAQLEEADYQRMVSNVDRGSHLHQERSGKGKLVPEFKSAQGQMIAIFNVVLVVGGAFAFGYKAVEYSLEKPDMVKQMFGGLILALIVAVADLYFLLKKLLDIDNQELTKDNANNKKPKSKSKSTVSFNSIREEFKNVKTQGEKKNE